MENWVLYYYATEMYRERLREKPYDRMPVPTWKDMLLAAGFFLVAFGIVCLDLCIIDLVNPSGTAGTADAASRLPSGGP